MAWSVCRRSECDGQPGNSSVSNGVTNPRGRGMLRSGEVVPHGEPGRRGGDARVFTPARAAGPRAPRDPPAARAAPRRPLRAASHADRSAGASAPACARAQAHERPLLPLATPLRQQRAIQALAAQERVQFAGPLARIGLLHDADPVLAAEAPAWTVAGTSGALTLGRRGWEN